jgi:sulfite exporter TauE/SafE
MIWAGFLMGVFGSLHCIGMCGPIALALPVHTSGKTVRLLAVLFYNAGRVVTYSILGALFGIVGTAFYLAGLQQILSIVSGVFLIILILFPIFFKRVFAGKSVVAIPYVQTLKHAISARLRAYTFSSLFLIGLLNGLLPCGLVTVAIVGAIAAGSVCESSVYMMLFGLGTVPAMAALVFSKNYVPSRLKQIFQRTVPVLVCSLGVLLILRGMSLGIPYVSPSAEKSCCTQTSCH